MRQERRDVSASASANASGLRVRPCTLVSANTNASWAKVRAGRVAMVAAATTVGAGASARRARAVAREVVVAVARAWGGLLAGGDGWVDGLGRANMHAHRGSAPSRPRRAGMEGSRGEGLQPMVTSLALTLSHGLRARHPHRRLHRRTPPAETRTSSPTHRLGDGLLILGDGGLELLVALGDSPDGLHHRSGVLGLRPPQWPRLSSPQQSREMEFR